ncbi:2-phospho-L-lactate guanylyltransferase [Halorientalis brevis]|uniref:2-phospho-L-lactate guanylyltransferase n=1 Tax=Halorientalis brevis TaxID=1126241 RepID=A0ABD6C8R3_9EURY|nr:2-phospho-L-lactate guanylyltransferase [Halorientalis brevis]
MRVVVPFATEMPKTRLGGVLTDAEREAFARAMLSDVLSALDATDHDPELLATDPVESDVPVTVDDRPLTEAVNAVLASSFETGAHEAVAVVMADLALATPRALQNLFAADGDVVLAPGRGGGTNALLVRHPAFRVDYHGASIRDHRRAAEQVGATVREVDSMRLATDVDEPADLVEVLLHGSGQSREWLREAGFDLDVTDGRVGLARDGTPVETN